MPWQAVAVIGGGRCTSEEEAQAEEVGRLLASREVPVVTGGLGGVMEAASRGAFEAGGLTVGILPGDDPLAANRYVRVPIATGLGEMRNFLVVRCSSAVIAIGGEYGTLNEVGMALKLGKPVIGLDTWELRRCGEWDRRVIRVASAAEAVAKALGG